MDRQKLIEENLKLVYFIVNTYYPRYISDEDITQVGMIGLCKAAKNYDENRGTFSTFAGKCIKNEINRELRNRNKRIPTLSLDYEYRGGEDSESFNLTETLLGDLDVEYIDLSHVYSKLNETGTKVLDLLLMGLSPKEVSKEVGISLTQTFWYIRKIKLLLGR